MDAIRTVTPQDLHRSIGTAASPVVVDEWRARLPKHRAVVVYCAQGHQVSQDVAAALAAEGCEVRFLEGGIAGWRALALPTRRRIGPAPGKWVRRERPKADRIACPWLVRRFIDPEAEFLYVPSAEVRAVAAETGAVPYDVAGVEFGHVGDRCSFDAFLRIFEIRDPALDRLALIVRGADTGRPELTPQSPGLLALSQGLSATIADDHEMLAHGMVAYDAFYAWCRPQERPSTPA